MSGRGSVMGVMASGPKCDSRSMRRRERRSWEVRSAWGLGCLVREGRK